MKLSSFQFRSFGSGFGIGFFCLIMIVQPIQAQELNATVEVDRSQISNASVNYLDGFAGQIESYLNEHNWTDQNYLDHERIDVLLQINLLSVDNSYNFEANAIIRSQRPVYNSVQQTPLFLFNDENWEFNFSPNSRLVHDELQFNDLATLLDFYAYIILGFDADSFSELGGSSYYANANDLVALAQSANSVGWSRSINSRRNRAQLVASLQNPNYDPLREASYIYHRHGVDQFLNAPEEAREQVISALELLLEARRNTTNNLLLDTFFNAKYREIVSIFEDAPTEIRLEAFNLLREVDPNHLTEYRKLE